ncbi:MAG: hypothetical protein A2090_04355 [Deltaproteobacteria bacterium GWD2_42_10]|nr:MAG: hypothetical protein A2090_04355 [Deltaproteobacteria bacterium GWD2_42_10]
MAYIIKTSAVIWAVKLTLLAIPLNLLSCEQLLLDTSSQYITHPARLLLYIHSTSYAPPDVTFTISEIQLQTGDDKWIKLDDSLTDIDATALIDKQIFLRELPVAPGLYKGIKFIISRAFIKSKDVRSNLAVPQPNGEVVIKSHVIFERNKSYVVSLVWNPDIAVEKGYLFQASSLEIETQTHAAVGLLLFVSNSASDYISIIDRSLERIIGAVTVGHKPMGMVLNSTQERLYIVNSGSKDISIVDTTQFSVIYTIPLAAGLEPTDIAIMPDDKNLIEGKLYIINRLSNDVTVINTTTKRIVKTVAVGTRPSAIAVNSTRKEVYVANERSNNISIISAIDDSLSATIAVDMRPVGLTVASDKVYVFNEGSNRISVVSPSLRKVVSTISIGDPPQRGMRGFSNRFFVLNTSANTLTFLNSFDVTTRTITLGHKPTGIVGDEKRNRLYITNYGSNTITLVDPIGERVLKELTVGKSPYAILSVER